MCPSETQARYRKEQTSAQLVPWIPPVDNLLKDSADGCALGALLHFYCPQLLPLGGKQAQCLYLNQTAFAALTTLPMKEN